MNPKTFGIFIAGAVVASGLTYYLVSKPEPPKPAAPPAAQTQPTPTPDPNASASTPASTPETSALPAEEPSKPSPVVQAETHESRGGWRKSGSKESHGSSRNAKYSSTTASKSHSTIPPTISTTTTAPAPQPESQPQVAQNTTPAPAAPAPAPEPARNDNPWNLPPPPPKPNSVTIPAGTTLTVRLGETITTERNREGDTFNATLDQPLVIDGFVVAERGARAQGRIVQSVRAGRVEGVSRMGVELVSLTTADGQHIKVNTGAFEKQGEQSRKKDAMKVGAGAAIGAAIGAIAGGGKGAGIGAAIGGGAGAADVMVTRGQPAEMPVETRVSFRLKEPVTVTEKLK